MVAWGWETSISTRREHDFPRYFEGTVTRLKVQRASRTDISWGWSDNIGNEHIVAIQGQKAPQCNKQLP